MSEKSSAWDALNLVTAPYAILDWRWEHGDWGTVRANHRGITGQVERRSRGFPKLGATGDVGSACCAFLP